MRPSSFTWARPGGCLPVGASEREPDRLISLGVLNERIPRAAVDEALRATGRQSARQRDLPAHVVVYYVIALALYMQSSYREVLRCLVEGLRWLGDPSARVWRGSRGFRRRARGWAPNRCKPCMTPWCGRPEPGCGYRQWHVVQWTAALWMSRTSLPTRRPSGAPARVAALPSPRSSCRWSRTEPTSSRMAGW